MGRFGLLLLVFLFTSIRPIAAQGDSASLYELPGATIPVYRSGSLQFARNGQVLLTANMFVDTVSIVELSQRSVLAEIPVGHDPRTIAVTPDSTRALVVNRADGSVSVIDLNSRTVTATYPVGGLPYAVITNNNQTANISLQGTDEVIEIEINTGHILRRVSVPDSPAGLTAWGDFLYVTHFWSGELSLIFMPQLRVVQTINMGADVALSQSLAIDSSNGRAYLPQTRDNPLNPAQTFDTWVFPVVNVVDLGALMPLRQSRIQLDQVDRPVNVPFAAAVDDYRNWLYVVYAGSDDLSVIDLSSGTTITHITVGANPRDIRLTWDNAWLYVHNGLDNAVTAIETYRLDRSETFFVSERTLPIDQLTGARLFHSASDPRISHDNRVSCANCHFDGQSDGRSWLIEGELRNTPNLYELRETAPYSWSGDWLTLDYLQFHIRDLQAGTGFSSHNDELDLDFLTITLLQLDAPSSPPQDPVLVEAGEELFESLNCVSCHAGSMGTDWLVHDVGTGGSFDTPALAGLWLGAPYFHDGRAATLRDVFILPGTHQIITEVSLDDIDALSAFLNSRP
jgi:YVTN family beta-propeller protein